ncbi:MAG: GTP 3',8-cyclase MoaA [Thermoproteota archaeon]|nr:GTP 3',8-cyclase MoaA [Thermoproteota archaeon]
MFKQNMEDNFGRIVKKLRISVTDRCNMRCVYCMPYNNTTWFEQDNLLSYEQIVHIASIFANLGIEKIKITGGEPTVRPKIEDLVNSLSNINGIKSISMTTNGLLLKDKVKRLKESGLQSVNVSLDTFDQKRFKSMTGITGGLNKVLDSISAANSVGLQVKINTVIMRGWNEDEIIRFAQFSRETGNIVKFIEFMPLDGTGIWTPNLVFSKKEMIDLININVKKLVPLFNDSSDPARLYSFDDGKGTIGFIPSITEPFCQNCDRIRITSEGKFFTCLFEKMGYDLKSFLQDGKSDDEIRDYILECINKKPEGIISIIRSNSLKPTLNLMNTIGG